MHYYAFLLQINQSIGLQKGKIGLSYDSNMAGQDRKVKNNKN